MSFSSPLLSRRNFVKYTSLSALLASLPRGVWAMSVPVNLSEVHREIAAKVKRKWGSSGESLSLFYPKGSLANLRPVVEEFRQLTGVELALEEASLDQISSEMIFKSHMGASTSNFDVALPATFGIPDLVEANAIADLTEFAEEHEPTGFLNDSLYNQGNLFRGRFYGYQTDGDAYLMFYHRNWLKDVDEKKKYQDRFGKPLDIAKTWEELDRQVQFFHRPEENRWGGSLFRNKNYIAWEFWIRLHAKGLYPFANDLTPQLAHPLSIEALQELVDVSTYLEPAVAKNGLFANFESYAQGNKFCNIGWGGTQKFLNGPHSSLKGQLLYSPAPGNIFAGEELCMPYFNWGWNYVVSSRSKKKELAYLFSLFASTPKVSIKSVKEVEGYFDPFRREHYADPEVISTYGSDFLRAHRESLRESIPDLYLPGRGNYFAALKQAVHAAYLKQVSAKKALEGAAQRWQEITKKLGEKKQIEQWSYLKKSYPLKLQKVLLPK